MLNYVTELDEMKEHPVEIRFKLLTKNIEEAMMLFVVYGFNAKSWIDEYNLAFSEIETNHLLVNATILLFIYIYYFLSL